MILKALPMGLEVEEGIVQVAVRETAEIPRSDQPKARRRTRSCLAEVVQATWLPVRKPGTALVHYHVWGDRWPGAMVENSPRFFRPTGHVCPRQALAVVRRTPAIPFFGATIGFIINYSPDHGVRFDLDGNPVEVFSTAPIARSKSSCRSGGGGFGR